MAYQKGQPKPPGSGRKKGTTNKVQHLTRARLYDRLSEDEERLFEELNSLEGRDYVNAYSKLLELAIGKTSNVSIEGSEQSSLETLLITLSGV